MDSLPILFETRPLTPTFGVEIVGVDVAHADSNLLSDVLATFHRSGVMVLRNQSLTRRALVDFTRMFGPLAENPRGEFADPDQPEIYVISNKIVDGRVIGEYDAGIGWHTDLAIEQRPALCTILYALEVPQEGSDTLIADMCAAYEELPETIKRQIEGRRVHHSFVGSLRRRGHALTDQQLKTKPDVFHPVVRRHPADGRKSIWASLNAEGIVGMPEPEGRNLLAELVAFATQDRFVYRHKWERGDILVWDDRCTMHTGTHFDKERFTRHVLRTMVRGGMPV